MRTNTQHKIKLQAINITACRLDFEEFVKEVRDKSKDSDAFGHHNVMFQISSEEAIKVLNEGFFYII